MNSSKKTNMRGFFHQENWGLNWDIFSFLLVQPAWWPAGGELHHIQFLGSAQEQFASLCLHFWL
jgi:hypothetical protein